MNLSIYGLKPYCEHVSDAFAGTTNTVPQGRSRWAESDSQQPHLIARKLPGRRIGRIGAQKAEVSRPSASTHGQIHDDALLNTPCRHESVHVWDQTVSGASTGAIHYGASARHLEAMR